MRPADRPTPQEIEAQMARDRFANWLRPTVKSVGAEYAGKRLADYLIYDDKQKPVVEAMTAYCRNIVEHLKRGEGFVLLGKSGTGKDHLAAAVMMHAARDRRIRTLAVNARELASMGFVAAEETIQELTRKNVGLVTISDPPEGMTATGLDRVYLVVEGRVKHGLAVALTINALTEQAIYEDVLGPAIWGRIRQRAVVIENCQWPDFRMGKKGNCPD